MKTKKGDLFVSKRYLKHRNLYYKEFKYILIFRQLTLESFETASGRVNISASTSTEYLCKVSISTKPTFSSNHMYSYVPEERLFKEYSLCIGEILKKL